MKTEPNTNPAELAALACYAPQWRRKPPDRPGQWWWWEPNWPDNDAVIVEVTAKCSGRLIGTNCSRWIVDCPVDEIGGWWAGPIEPSPPPLCSHSEKLTHEAGDQKL